MYPLHLTLRLSRYTLFSRVGNLSIKICFPAGAGIFLGAHAPFPVPGGVSRPCSHLSGLWVKIWPLSQQAVPVSLSFSLSFLTSRISKTTCRTFWVKDKNTFTRSFGEVGHNELLDSFQFKVFFLP